jgi:hypothetical protein
MAAWTRFFRNIVAIFFYYRCPVSLTTIASAGDRFEVFLRFPLYFAHGISPLVDGCTNSWHLSLFFPWKNVNTSTAMKQGKPGNSRLPVWPSRQARQHNPLLPASGALIRLPQPKESGEDTNAEGCHEYAIRC